jgi:hypothetical protein
MVPHLQASVLYVDFYRTQMLVGIQMAYKNDGVL